jgi:serine/threonine protein phosphatase PrpC
VQEDDEFVVLGSDGLWDTLQPQDVVRMVHDTVKHPTMCAKRLVAEAMQNGGSECHLSRKECEGVCHC